MKNVIFLYSHGFATHADDKGLFTEIELFFPGVQHIFFEYDEWNGDEAVAASFSERAKKLQAKYAEVRSEYPDAEINLICHSQGCIVAMLASLDGIKKRLKDYCFLALQEITHKDGTKQYLGEYKNKSFSIMLTPESRADNATKKTWEVLTWRTDRAQYSCLSDIVNTRLLSKWVKHIINRIDYESELEEEDYDEDSYLDELEEDWDDNNYYDDNEYEDEDDDED